MAESTPGGEQQMLVDQLSHDPARPQELTALMNRLLAPLTAGIQPSGGTMYRGRIEAFCSHPLRPAGTASTPRQRNDGHHTGIFWYRRGCVRLDCR